MPQKQKENTAVAQGYFKTRCEFIHIFYNTPLTMVILTSWVKAQSKLSFGTHLSPLGKALKELKQFSQSTLSCP